MTYEPPAIVPSGTTFPQLQEGGVSGVLERLISANSAGWTAVDYQLARAAKDGNIEDIYRRLRQITCDFNRGTPIDHDLVVKITKQVHRSFAILNQLCLEVGELVAGNPGEIRVDGSVTKRMWS